MVFIEVKKIKKTKNKKKRADCVFHFKEVNALFKTKINKWKELNYNGY
jgi:hypothetical protein